MKTHVAMPAPPDDSSKVVTVKISIAGREIELTENQVRQLSTELDRLLGKSVSPMFVYRDIVTVTSPQPTIPAPNFPYPNWQPWCGTIYGATSGTYH